MPYVRDIATQLLTYIQCSVCIVNYRNLVKDDILTSEKNACPIGVYLAKFIKYLEAKGVPNNKVNLVAHSLGAKVASECGRTINGRLEAIYGKSLHFPSLYSQINSTLQLNNSVRSRRTGSSS